MKKRDKTEGSSVYINRGTERTRNRFFWRKGDVYENTYGRVCRVRDAHQFLRWGARRTEGHHSYYQRLKPVYEAYQRAKDKAAFRSSHEAELVIFEAARSTLLAIQGDVKLPSLKLLKAEQEQLTQEQQRLYEERANLKKQAKQIDTIRANVISYLNLSPEQETQKDKDAQREKRTGVCRESLLGKFLFFSSGKNIMRSHKFSRFSQ